jgi:hypothetical protein
LCLDSDRLENITSVVTAMAKDTRNFAFCAHWFGEDLEAPQGIKLQALVKLIQSNTIARNVPYVLGNALV